MQAKERLKKLEQLYTNGVALSGGQAFSVETLLDILVVLYDECCSSTLRREKSVSEFVEFGEYFSCFCDCNETHLFLACMVNNVHCSTDGYS
jgi:hypothetical protein